MANNAPVAAGLLGFAQSRGGAIAFHEKVRVGDLLPVSAPINRFPLAAAGEVVMIAGGIGIAPFLPMVAALLPTGSLASTSPSENASESPMGEVSVDPR